MDKRSSLSVLFVNDTDKEKARVFIPAKLFQPSLLFLGKARGQP